MHKYQPRIHLVKRPDGASGQIIDLDNEEYKTFIFPETVFTAVTAYQNQLVSSHFFKNSDKRNLTTLTIETHRGSTWRSETSFGELRCGYQFTLVRWFAARFSRTGTEKTNPFRSLAVEPSIFQKLKDISSTFLPLFLALIAQYH